MRKLLLVGMMIVGGCAMNPAAEGYANGSAAVPINAANGAPAWQISCVEGVLGPYAACVARAKALCPAGFDYVDRPSGAPTRGIVIACKG